MEKIKVNLTRDEILNIIVAIKYLIEHKQKMLKIYQDINPQNSTIQYADLQNSAIKEIKSLESTYEKLSHAFHNF